MKLRNYISQLSNNELIDLCALMEYGRAFLHDISEKEKIDFSKIRISCAEIHKNDTKETISTYLLKNNKLSEYLKKAIDVIK